MFKLVYIGPKEFRVLAYRLIVTGVIILVGFNLGSWFYLYTVSSFSHKVPLKNFASILNASVQKDLELEIGNDKKTIKSGELKSWIEPYTRTYSGKRDLRVSSKFNDYLIQLAAATNIEPVNAKFEFGNDNKAAVFSQSVRGKRLNVAKSAATIITALRENTAVARLVVDTIEPEITLEKVNNLGIETLLARGESDFHGSSNARIHNIKTGSTKFNGTIIKPGEEFSFNDILGEVGEKEGYQPEMVIKGGQTIPEYGGGLCQVSTTIFRAAILAGLPITERRPHSFPVKYYSPQGFDATIYPGVSDLKFTNDTKGHILLQTRLEDTRLFVELYGSSDERQVALDGPHQYDQKASGAMKAYFIRIITSIDGDKKDERFDSNYQPPFAQARNPLE
ncbi:MAG: VanW family protein [Candidatus Yanofskybacteria bacterium]|nr:VanW family protein [Candidatus Yanofskybacteria bacterium]